MLLIRNVFSLKIKDTWENTLMGLTEITDRHDYYNFFNCLETAKRQIDFFKRIETHGVKKVFFSDMKDNYPEGLMYNCHDFGVVDFINDNVRGMGKEQRVIYEHAFRVIPEEKFPKAEEYKPEIAVNESVKETSKILA